MKIFENYIGKFFVLKIQYSGVKKCGDHKTNRKKLSDYLLQQFGIFVKWEDIPIEKNEAMRYVMKLILNSLWGKLCQNPNKASVYFVSDYEELLSYVCDKKYESVYFDVLNSNVACVVCNYKDEYNNKTNKVSLSIGSYITCYLRLKLLDSLLKLPPKSVLYYDTDSIFYYSKYCEELLDTRSNLGELSSELEQDEHITSFVSTGPKSYSYITNKGKEITHVKGFKLSKKVGKSSVDPNFLYKLIEDQDCAFEIEDDEKFKINK